MNGTIDELEARLEGIEEAWGMYLQSKFEYFVKTLPHLPLPDKCLAVSDFHAGDGGIGKHVDPLKSSGLESSVLDLLDARFILGYSLFIHEIWDLWRGFTLDAVKKAHPDLWNMIEAYKKEGLLYWVDSNHSRDILTLPMAYIFEGFGKKVYLDHGHFLDWPNCRGWKVGRLCVRTADTLGIDPETSPHVTSTDRHAYVRKLRQVLADNNPEWDFFWGHTHYFDNPVRSQVITKGDRRRKLFCVNPDEFDEATMDKVGELQNNHNDGSPITGKLTYFLIEEGVITPKIGNT
jgi:hypothetical protein